MGSTVRSSPSVATRPSSLPLGICLLFITVSSLLARAEPGLCEGSSPTIATAVATGSLAPLFAQAGTSALAATRSHHHHRTAGTARRLTGTAGCDCNRACGTSPCTECCPGSKTFVVHYAQVDVTVKVNDKTKYIPKGKSFDDIKAGARVAVTYRNDGTDNWALTVHFLHQKAEAPAKTGGRR
jgi:hypothetical protein